MLQVDPSRTSAGRWQAAGATAREPAFGPVERLERSAELRLVGAALIALLLHVAFALNGLTSLRDVRDFARTVRGAVQERLRQSIEIQAEPEPEPEPPPEPKPPAPEPPAPEPPPKAEPKPPPVAKAPAEPPPPAPAAAQAARVVTAEPDPDEPIDLTGNSFVQGNADFYAGGVTASKGTSTEAVRNRAARADGVQGGTGQAPASAVDRSRPAGTLQRNWDCPFPPEAELEQINFQQVNVAVTVSDKGRALDVKVLGETNFGFGRAAQRCALSKTFVPALNRDGLPITTTIPIVVTFVRR